MIQVNMHEAKTHLSRLVDRAHAGETIIIAKNGKPWAKLNPTDEDAKAAPFKPQSRIGILGQMGMTSWAAPDWKDHSEITEMLENRKYDSEHE